MLVSGSLQSLYLFRLLGGYYINKLLLVGCRRMPSLFSSNVALVQRLFDSLIKVLCRPVHVGLC